MTRGKRRDKPAIITTAIIKGGTGKTTTAAALAQAAKERGFRVLAIDLDAQGNLSDYLDGDTDKAGSYEALHGAGNIAELIQTTPQGIDLLSACADLSTEKTSAGSAKRLQNAIEPIKGNYDFIFIDTPPSMSELTFNALQASTALLIPLDADTASIKGLYQVADIAGQMKERSAKDLSFIGVLITRYRGRANVNQFLRDAIAEAAEKIGAAYLGEIRDGIAVRESQAMRKDLYKYAGKSNPAKDYMDLFETIKKKI